MIDTILAATCVLLGVAVARLQNRVRALERGHDAEREAP